MGSEKLCLFCHQKDPIGSCHVGDWMSRYKKPCGICEQKMEIGNMKSPM